MKVATSIRLIALPLIVAIRVLYLLLDDSRLIASQTQFPVAE